MALFYWCINSFLIPNLGDSTSTSFGEKPLFYSLDFCPKSKMATVLSLSTDDFSQIQWLSTNGNAITFRVRSNITLNIGCLCSRQSVSVQNNGDFPTDIPELHFEIQETPSGSETIEVSEDITITMTDIYQPVVIKLVVKEGGNIKRETVYNENPIDIERSENGGPVSTQR